MINYDKVEIREQLQIEHIFALLQLWGGEPEYTNFGIISSTICHNPPGIGSRKLYFYENSGLFICYTGCAESFFDVFELCRKVNKIQKDVDIDLIICSPLKRARKTAEIINRNKNCKLIVD